MSFQTVVMIRRSFSVILSETTDMGFVLGPSSIIIKHTSTIRPCSSGLKSNSLNGPNHVWAVDFVYDKLSNNRPYKMLTVVDEYTGPGFSVHVAHTMAICIWAVTQMSVCEAPFQNIYL